MRPLFAVVALAVSATCATPNTGSAAALSFDCDTPSDRFSVVSMELAAPLRVSGVIEPVLLRSGDFLPAAGITVLDEAGNFVRVQLAAQNSRSNRLHIHLNVRSEEDSDENYIAQVSRDPLPFLLTVSAEGKVRLEMAGSVFDAETVPMGTTTVSVGCSNGEFIFSDLKLESDPVSED